MAKTYKHYDLEDRTLVFAKNVRTFVKSFLKTTSDFEDGKQLIRSSGSRGANYIEANEAFSKKDFAHRIKICRKEAKETIYWLKLIETTSQDQEKQKPELVEEATQLMKIFSAIMRKST